MTTENIPWLVAHRGDMREYPENSWPALQAAVEAGACWLEFDIQMCADGTFVLLHDADFRRTGEDTRSVFNLDAADCRDISVHQADKFGDRFKPAVTPLLDEVLTWLSEQTNVRAMVEIKTESLDHFGRENVISTLLETLHGHYDRCVLISFDDTALHLVSHTDPLQIGWVLHRYNDAQRKRAEQLNPDYLICNQKKIPSDEPLWSGTWQWMLYDILDPQQALGWAQRGIRLIETGDITRLIKHPLLARNACRHDV
ncbi:glycerophosphoryl diester phosphodiesterase [Thiogranum longum]|uniref:Glycerophosphoryl diester phosphodiesterase n=1 Tax=Thiogranum longum TaxID=1537524 RepID=A0A4V2PGM2_9GAMM|nr:glycerophosphodiester phosphodiesterase family protein [Thiogranum longum]TCK17366.1 glycerophosphoryl diester phosphodiesterase [Thiogranum longum]